MRNITLSVDEQVLAAARRYSAEHDSSVNAFVRECMAQITRRSDRARKARSRIRQLSGHSPARIEVITWKRDELHDR
jgi:hypothetical protein